jgi:uncharacterized phage protein (TIGR02218 family)
VKVLPPALQASLSSGVTTLCHCWRVTRADGTVLGFTEHDRDVTADGTTFSAGTGFSASRLEQSLGLSIDNMEAAGAFSSAGITEADLLAGRYDDAAVDMLLVDWRDPATFVLLSSGNLGEVKREGLAFSAELRSLAHRLNQKIGSTYSRICEAQLGDARCKVDLTQPTMRSAFTAASGTSGRVIAAAGLSGFAPDWFTAGTLTFSTGADAGILFEVKSHRRTAGIDQLELWLPPPFPMAVGDAGTVVAGCRKTLAVCGSKFANVANFRGFPHIPGSDAVTRYGVQGALGASGGSLFGGG